MPWLAAALLGGFFFFNASATPAKVANAITAMLRQEYPGATVVVEVKGHRGMDVVHAKFEEIHIDITHLKVDDLPFQSGPPEKKQGHAGLVELDVHDLMWNGMPVDAASFTLHDVAFNVNAISQAGVLQIASCGPSTEKISLTEAGLDKILAVKLPKVKDSSVASEHGLVTIGGEEDLMGVDVPFEMKAIPEGVGRELRFLSADVTVGGVPLPQPAVDHLLRDLNPIFVFDPKNHWPFVVNLKDVRAHDGRLELNGDLPFRGPVPVVAATGPTPQS